MKYEQFISDHCVVCFEDEETCMANLKRLGPNRLDFMVFPIIPLKIWELPIEKARFHKIYEWRIPEHQWFHRFSTTGWKDFQIEMDSWSKRTTTEEEGYFKEMLLQKWTTTGPFLIQQIEEFETFRHARNLWGVSPIDQQEWEFATLRERKRMSEYYMNNYENDKIKREIEEGERKAHRAADLADCIYPAPMQLEIEEDEWRFNAVRHMRGLADGLEQEVMELDEFVGIDTESANSGESVADVDTIVITSSESSDDSDDSDATVASQCDTTTAYYPYNSSSSDEEDGPSPPKRRVPDWLKELAFSSDSNESEGWRSFSSTEEY